MTIPLPSPDWLTDAPSAWDDDDALDLAWDLADLDGECAPRLTTPIHVTDLQHWIDLCA